MAVILWKGEVYVKDKARKGERNGRIGLGYSFVEVREHSIGMDLRLWVLATPVDGALIDFTLRATTTPLAEAR